MMRPGCSTMSVWFRHMLCMLSLLVVSSCRHSSEPPTWHLSLQDSPSILGIVDRAAFAGELDGRYLSCDLNDDGRPEYLAVTSAGVHSASFALFAANGTLMQEELMFGDRLVVLRPTSHGYHDLLCSYSDHGEVSEMWLRFDGTQYVGCRSLKTRTRDSVAYVERESDNILVCWYADLWSMPPTETAPGRTCQP